MTTLEKVRAVILKMKKKNITEADLKPEGGRLKVSALDRPGFGVRLNPDCALHLPYPAA